MKCWRCKQCGWLMAEVQYLSIKCDLGCPRCGESLAKFKEVNTGNVEWSRCRCKGV